MKFLALAVIVTGSFISAANAEVGPGPIMYRASICYSQDRSTSVSVYPIQFIPQPRVSLVVQAQLGGHNVNYLVNSAVGSFDQSTGQTTFFYNTEAGRVDFVAGPGNSTKVQLIGPGTDQSVELTCER